MFDSAYFVQITVNMIGCSHSITIEFSLNVFTEFAEFSDKNNIICKKIAVLEPTISCVRDIDSTTAPQRHS